MTRPCSVSNCRRCTRALRSHRQPGPWETRHAARGLCAPCYQALEGTDALLDYEPVTRSRDELMGEWALLRSEGLTKRQAAARLGVSHTTFDRAFHRARVTGDPRALPALSTAVAA